MGSDPPASINRQMTNGKEIMEGEGEEGRHLPEMTCGVCLSDVGRPVRGHIDSCDHHFCFVCILEWARVETRCPMCKRRFRSIHRPAVPGIFALDLVVDVPERNQLPKEQEAGKKEKRRDKKEMKEKGEKSKHDSSKHMEHGHKKRKHEEMDELPMKDGLQKAAALSAKKVNDQLEKSGLTDDHGQTCSVQEPCESSDSTQNSSKSRKLESGDISGGSHGGTILPLRLTRQKHKDRKLSPTPVNDEQLFSGRVTSKDLKATPTGEATCFSGRTTSRVTSASDGPCSSGRTTSEVLTASPSRDESCFSGRTTSKDLEVTPASRGPWFSGRATTKDLRATPASQGPSFSGCDLSKDLEAASCLAGHAIEAALLHKLRDNAHSQPIGGSKLQLSIVEDSKSTETTQEQTFDENAHIHCSSSSKGSKSARKLEKQFRDLIVKWRPAPMLLDAEDGAEDLSWLVGNSAQHCVKSGDTSRGVSDPVEDLRCGSRVGSFQTKALYLPELEMYQLPYVVPF